MFPSRQDFKSAFHIQCQNHSEKCCRPTALLSSNTLAAFFLCACTYSMNWQAASSWVAVASWVTGSASRSTSPGAPSSSLSSASSLLSLLDKASSAIVVPLCGESRASIPSRVRRCFVFGVSAQTEPTALLRYHPLHEDRPSSMLSTNQALVSVRGTRERMCVQVVPSLSSAHASRV